LLYLDPPYYKAGRYLYFNSYKESDHAIIKDNILRLKAPWVVSYDDVPEIRRLYRGIKSQRLQLLHTARSLRMGNELLFFAPNLRAPAFL
jgi:DNA adenine methylase